MFRNYTLEDPIFFRIFILRKGRLQRKSMYVHSGLAEYDRYWRLVHENAHHGLGVYGVCIPCQINIRIVAVSMQRSRHVGGFRTCNAP